MLYALSHRVFKFPYSNLCVIRFEAEQNENEVRHTAPNLRSFMSIINVVEG